MAFYRLGKDVHIDKFTYTESPVPLVRLVSSMALAHYVGDNIPLSFHMDRKVDIKTLRIANNFDWPHGNKLLHRRIIQGGLIRAVSESWYPTSDHSFGLLLEDDVEVSPFFYLWLKYTLLVYHYDPKVMLNAEQNLDMLLCFYLCVQHQALCYHVIDM